MALGTLGGALPLSVPQLEPDVKDGGYRSGHPGSDPKARPNVDERGLSMPWPLRAAISPQPHFCSLLMVQVEWRRLPPPPVPVCAGSLMRRSVAFSLERHLLWIRSHTVSWGQQCRWSEQQMAWVRAKWSLGFPVSLELREQPGRQLALPQSPTRGWHES